MVGAAVMIMAGGVKVVVVVEVEVMDDSGLLPSSSFRAIDMI